MTPLMWFKGERMSLPPLQPDECLALLSTICSDVFDPESPEVSLRSDQWINVRLGCQHGSWGGNSAGWESDAIAVAFTHALNRFEDAHSHDG